MKACRGIFRRDEAKRRTCSTIKFFLIATRGDSVNNNRELRDGRTGIATGVLSLPSTIASDRRLPRSPDRVRPFRLVSKGSKTNDCRPTLVWPSGSQRPSALARHQLILGGGVGHLNPGCHGEKAEICVEEQILDRSCTTRRHF